MTALGNVPASSTIELMFTTHSQMGAAIAPLSGYEAADVQLYKSDSATQRSSTSGWTMTSPFDSIVGLHSLKIDLSDNTDAGFYAAGSFYTAVLAADTETVDGLSVVAVIGTFRIVAAENTAGTPAVDAVRHGGTAQTGRDIGASVLLSAGSGTGQLDFTSGVVKANLAQILGTALTETAGQIAAGFKKLFDVAAPVFTLLSVNQTGDSYARLGAPAGASHAADVAAVKVDTAAVKVQTDKLAFTVANQVDSNVIDWKGSAAPAMTGDAYARLGAPAGASVSADVAATKALLPTALASDGSIKASLQSILGTAFTEGAGGRIAAAWKQFFNIASPTSTMNEITLVDTLTTYTGNTPQTGDVYPKVDTEVATLVTGVADVQARLPSALVSGRMDSSVGSMAANVITAAAAATDFGTEIATAAAAAVWATAIESGHTALQLMRVMSAVLLGKVSGAASNAPVFRDVGDTKARVTATTDVYGDRTSVTLDES